MSSRTKIAIVGADPSGFHIFQTLYKSDDRFEVACFIDIGNCVTREIMGKYPPELSGQGYPHGIPILHASPFQHILVDRKIEKCICSPFCITSSMYLYVAAQCLAAQCTIVSHSLESTRLPPPKPLVSFFADTQFDVRFLLALLEHYKKFRPLVLLPAPLDLFKCVIGEGRTHLIVQNLADLEKLSYRLGNHDKAMCELIITKFPICFAWDLDNFAVDSLRDTSYDLIIFAGQNSLPCFFQSHLLVYACDDFTFGEDLTQHPSWTLCQQADVIFVAGLRGDELSQRISEVSKAQVVHVPVEFTGRNQSCYSGRPCLLFDDWYPVSKCNAVQSISLFLATHFHMKPISVSHFESTEKKPSEAPIYGEPTEANWPALIVPDNSPSVTSLMETCGKVISEKKIDCHVIVSSAQLPPDCTIAGIPVIQFNFSMKIEVPKDSMDLPAAAFVRHRRGK